MGDHYLPREWYKLRMHAHSGPSTEHSQICAKRRTMMSYDQTNILCFSLFLSGTVLPLGYHARMTKWQQGSTQQGWVVSLTQMPCVVFGMMRPLARTNKGIDVEWGCWSSRPPTEVDIELSRSEWDGRDFL